MKAKEMNLKQFVKRHWRTYEECAFDLGVNRNTIYNYVNTNPTGILRHTHALIEKDNVEALLLFDAVAKTMEQLNENRKRG